MFVSYLHLYGFDIFDRFDVSDVLFDRFDVFDIFVGFHVFIDLIY